MSLAALQSRRLALWEQASPAGSPVVLYALTKPGGDPCRQFAACTSIADSLGLRVVERIHDATGTTDPATRPGWTRVIAAIASTAAAGAVAVSRHEISPFTDLYAEELARLGDHRAVLCLVRRETDSVQSPTSHTPPRTGEASTSP